MRAPPDSSVDTKSLRGSTFGTTPSLPKVEPRETFGNDAVGFIRARKRKLKGGHRDWRAYRARTGTLASTSTSFDLVKAVRVDGKPRHEFVLGLGSQKDVERHGGHDLCWFWAHAVHRMIKHGLAEDQRDRLLSEMVRKGARFPTIAECEEHARSWPLNQSAINGLISWLTAGAAS
jgi:hypothetical protein